MTIRLRAVPLPREIGPLLALAGVWTAFALLAGSEFAALANQRLMLLQTAVVGVAAVGATAVIVAGGIDLSVGSNIALGTVVVALALRAGADPWLAGAAGVAGGLVCGAVIGNLVTGRLTGGRELSPFVVSLGLWGALRGAAKGLADNQPVYPDATGMLGDLMRAGDHGVLAVLPPGVWLLLVAALVAALVLRGTRFGLHVYAVGSNAATARLCGIDVGRTKRTAYALAGGCAGLAALLQFSFLQMGDPTTAEGYELDVIAAVVIGGASLTGGEGTILGTLIGAVLMTVIDNGCTKIGLDNWVQDIITGGIIVLAVVVDRFRRS